MTTTTYSSNNSGGSWWLSDEDWKALETAGWEVEWFTSSSNTFTKPGKDGKWLGALAARATRSGIGFREAIAEWESVTGARANELGCSCCGTPHGFSSDENDYYSPEAPLFGSGYR